VYLSLRLQACALPGKPTPQCPMTIGRIDVLVVTSVQAPAPAPG
jgi:hypothetical protein